MSTIIAETYILEIKAWQSLIMFYKKQLDVLKHKLYQAFKTPVLIKDSARLENYQVHIIAIQDYLYEIETSIQKQYDKIDSYYLFDDLNKNEIIEREQLLLRYKMYITEKKCQMIGLAYNSLRKKVADALIRLNNTYNKAASPDFKIDISRDNLAAIAGTATESLIRTLTDFKSEKLIDISNNCIKILNKKRLEDLSN